MAENIQQPMSETTIQEHPDTEKRPREEEENSDIPEASGKTKRRELEVNSDRRAETDQTEPISNGFHTSTSFGALSAKANIFDATPVNASESSQNSSAGNSNGFGSAKGFASLASSKSAFSNFQSAGFSSLLQGQGDLAHPSFTSLLDENPQDSIFSTKASNDEGEDESAEQNADNVVDDEQYVAVKGLEKAVVSTGEENESCIHTVRAKLFALNPRHLDDGWKERGVGTLRILKSLNADQNASARLVMRADAVLRVILNMPLRNFYKLEDGGESMGEKTIRIFGVEDGTGTWLAIRVNSKQAAKALSNMVQTGMDLDTNTASSQRLPDKKPASDGESQADTSEVRPTTSKDSKSPKVEKRAEVALHQVSGLASDTPVAVHAVSGGSVEDSVVATEVVKEKEIEAEKE